MSGFAGGGSASTSIATSYLAADATALTDASNTKLGTLLWLRMPAATQSANRTVTIDPTGLRDGEHVRVTDLDFTQYTLAFVNGGPGAGTLYTSAAFQGCDVILKYTASTGDLTVAQSEDLYASAVAPTANTIPIRGATGGVKHVALELDTTTAGTQSYCTLLLGGGYCQLSSVSAGAGSGFVITSGGAPLNLVGAAGGGNLGVTSSSFDALAGIRCGSYIKGKAPTGAGTTGAFNVDLSTGSVVSTGTLAGDSTITLTNIPTGTETQLVDLVIVSNKSLNRLCTINGGSNVVFGLEAGVNTSAALAAAVASVAVQRVIVTLRCIGGVVYVERVASFGS